MISHCMLTVPVYAWPSEPGREAPGDFVTWAKLCPPDDFGERLIDLTIETVEDGVHRLIPRSAPAEEVGSLVNAHLEQSVSG